MRRDDETRRRREREAARPESTPSTLESIERVALHHQIVETVLALDEPYRTTVVLRFWEDRPPREIARRMGVPVSTVRTRVRRALAILRDRLDHSFDNRSAWTGVLAIGAERATAAGATTVPTASLALAGVLLMATKIKLVAAIIAASVLFWMSWNALGVSESPSETGEQEQTVADTKVATEEHEPMTAQREQVQPPRTSAPAVDEIEQAPFLVDPYEVRIHVVDAAGESIPGATITVWDVAKARRVRDSSEIVCNGERQGSVPFLRGLTDRTGRCTLELDRAMVYVNAVKRGIGESNDWPCSPRTVQRQGGLLIALTPGVRLRGLVLRANGLPAANVDVRLRSTSISTTHERVRSPKPTKTNWEGRFEISLRPGTSYRVEAQDAGKRAEARVLTLAPGDKEVLLRFSGALSIRGFLLDPHDRPIAGGRVRLWETVDMKDRDPAVELLITSARTKGDGSFRIDVERHGLYRILGTAKGYANSELTGVEVTAVHPHADTMVRLMQLTSIAGVVRHENGRPIEDARMFLTAEQGEDPMWADRPTRRDLFAGVGFVKTGKDGSFRFRGTHPKATYTLTCCPDPKYIGIKIRQKRVHPGRQDVLIVLTESAIRGSSITGTVLVDETGEPVAEFSIEFVHYRDDGTVRATSDAGSAVIESGSYTLPGLSLGATYSFVVKPKHHAPMLVGPINTTLESHALNVRLKQLGEIECRVVDAQGKAVANITVAARPVVRVPGAGRRVSARTNADGKLRTLKVPPGKWEVYVIRNGQRHEGNDIKVVPGKTTEVELRIRR